jgi:hypothetical protein
LYYKTDDQTMGQTPMHQKTASDRKRPADSTKPPIKDLFAAKQADIEKLENQSVLEVPPPLSKKRKPVLERFQFDDEEDKQGEEEFIPTGFLLPHEQQATHLRPLYTRAMEKLISAPSETSAFLLPTPLPETATEWFDYKEYLELSLGDDKIQQAHFGAYVFPPEMQLGPTLSAAAGKIFPDHQCLHPGIISNDFRANVLNAKPTEDAKISAYYERNLKLVTNAPNPLEILQPAFLEKDFYTNSDSIKALRSGIFASGASFTTKSEVFTTALTPMHFIPTIQKGFRLPEAGWTARQCLEYTQNQVFVFNHMFVAGNRYPVLKRLNDCLSPWLLSGPLAGQYAFVLNHFSQRKLNSIWDQQGTTTRLKTTLAFVMAIQQLWEIFLDWSNHIDREKHCVKAIFLKNKSRSDLVVFKGTVRLRNEKLSKLLEVWRQQFATAFGCDTLDAQSLPITGFYNIKAPADILPEFKKQQNKHPDRTTTENTKSGKFKRNENATTKTAIKTCAKWTVTGVTITDLLNESNLKPEVDGRKVCFPFCLHLVGCSHSNCKRLHIDLHHNPASWTRQRLHQLTAFFEHPAVRTRLHTSSWYRDAVGVPQDGTQNTPPSQQPSQPQP